jgi:hypothetical protein
MAESPEKKKSKVTKLRALGFCGADDSVNPNLLGIFSHSYPFVEFGVLFRPDKQGKPRYASPEWVQKLSLVAKLSHGRMRLAAHLCGTRVNEVLDGNDSFLKTLGGLGFQRVQVNATAVNGVELEFILQKNDETKPLWEGLLNMENDAAGKAGYLPENVSMLVDESKGTGVLASSWPNPPDGYAIGYAGGIGPKNIDNVLQDVFHAAKGREIWIDMESSLRSMKDGKDVFDLDKCYDVIEKVCRAGVHCHPSFLP